MVMASLAKMNNLQSPFEVQCKSNVDKFATKLIDILLKLAKNGGAGAQTFDKCYEVLSHSPCQSFNLELIVYKQVNAQALNVNKLLIKAHKEYCTMAEKNLDEDSRKTTLQ